MRKVGNVVSNQIYNPDNKRPPVPVDADEADSAMERFIRQKYMNNVVNSKPVEPGSPRIDEGVPPPLPPKNSSSKFGLRSAASLFPLSRSKKETKPLPSPGLGRPSSHDSVGKSSRMFGSAGNYDETEDLERKLARLRDMGFSDMQRNMSILQAVNGNIDRAVEQLVRMGEGGSRSPAPGSRSPIPPPPPREKNLRATKSLTPLNPQPASSGLGLSIQPRSTQDQPATPSSVSTNPFDGLTSPAQPQTAQSTGSLSHNNPYNNNNISTNPFGPVRQQTDPLNQAFQKLDLTTTNSQQPLFPNRTGGLTPLTPNRPPLPSLPVPSAPTTPQFYQQMQFQSMAYPQTAPLQQQPTGMNPFLPASAGFAQQQVPQHTLMVNTQQSAYGVGSNPFARSPTRVASPTTLGQIPEQSPPLFQNTSPQLTPGANNPFLTTPPVPQQQSFHPLRHDKASIMALYGSAVPVVQPDPTAMQNPQASPLSAGFAPAVQAPQMVAQPVRSMTMPVETTTNPFMNGGNSQAQPSPFSSTRHISRESMNLGMDMAWTNGRHSPDAFASLSAKHV